MAKYAELFDGTILEFPDETEDSIINATAKRLTLEKQIGPEQTGFIPSLKEGAIGAFESTVRGVTAPFQPDETIRSDIAQQQAEAQARNVGMTTFADVREAEGVLPTIGKTYEFARDALGRSLPYMVPMVTGAATGARVGAVGGPLGAIAGGIIGGIAGGTPMFAGENIRRRVEEQTPGALVDPEVYGTAVLQATLDTAGGAVTLGRGIIGRIIGKDALRASDDELADIAQQSLTKTVGGAAARGAAAEMPTEIAQQMLERRQAGLSLTSEDALAEYGEAGAAAFILGGALGGVGGVATRSGARTEQERRAAVEQAGFQQGERARQEFAAQVGEDAELAAERQADLAGFAEANKAYTDAVDTAAKVRSAIPQGFATEQIKKLETVEGTQDLLNNFDSYFDLSPADTKQLKTGFLKNINALRKKEAEYKKLTDEQKKTAIAFEAYSKLGVSSQQELEAMPLRELQNALNVLTEEQAGTKKESRIPLLNKIEDILKDAIKKATPPEVTGTLQVPPYEPGPPAVTTLTSFEQLGQPEPEPVVIPPNAFPAPQPELTIEERMAQLERAQQEQEAADFELQEQYPEPVAPSSQEVMKGEANEPTPSVQGRLFTATGKPTAAAGRQPVSGTEVTPEVSDTDGQGSVDSVVLPRESTEAAAQEAEGPRAGGLGIADRPSEGGAVRRGRGAEEQPATLVHEPSKIRFQDRGPLTMQDLVAAEITNPDFERLDNRINDIERVYAELIPLREKISNLVRPRSVDKNRLKKLEEELQILHYTARSAAGDPYQQARTKLGELLDEVYYIPLSERLAKLQSYVAELKEKAQGKQVTTARKRAAELLEEAEPTTREEANKRAERDITEAKAREAEGYDPDEFLYSKPGKSKRKKDGSYKQVPSLKTLKADKPSSVEAVEKAAERLFNPVWLKQAQNQGWLHILPGKPSDVAELADANIPNAQGVYMGRKGHVYIFPENIPAGGERGVLLHEIGEHKGLEAMIGAENVTRLANRVRTMAKGSDRDAEIAKRALERAEESGTVDDKEIVAYFTEVAVNEAGIEPGGKPKPGLGKALQWINELWNSISAAMRKLALNVNTINSQDMVDIVYGAARLQMGATDTSSDTEALTPEDTEILRQSARNPALELSPEERAQLEAQGIPIFPPPQQETMKQKMVDTMGLSEGFQNWLNRWGNAVVGPLFTLHKKSSAFYGPEQFYSKTRGKLLGSLMAQHALNANNLAFDALKYGTADIDERGFVSTVVSDDNIRTVNKDYSNIMAAMQRDGMSPAMAYQNTALMILAPRYKSLIKMGIKSKDEFSSEAMTAAERLQSKYATEYKQWRDRYNRVRKNKREFLIKSGLVTEAKADELLDRAEYVPFYRIKDSEGMDGVFMQNLLAAKGEQKLDFDTKDFDVADVMSNIAKNEMWLYKRAIYNHTTNLTVDQVEEMGGGKHLKVRPKDAKGVITYLRDGKLMHFKFDDPNDMAVFVAVPAINSAVVRMMTNFGRLLRRTITLTPSFVYRQVWQDVERAWMQSGTNKNFVSMLGTSIREQAANFRKQDETEIAKALRNRGVIGAVEYQDSFDNALDELLEREPDGATERLYKFMERAEKLAQNSDMAARAIVYKNALNEVNPSTGQKYTPGEAALRAQMMLNYQHRGTSPMLRTLLSTIPFINTKIQGEWRLIEALQGKIPGLPKENARKLLAAKIAKMMLFTTAYAMLRMDDDDYENASDETRNRNFLFNLGGVSIENSGSPRIPHPKSSGGTSSS